jgi:hypothetical protein
VWGNTNIFYIINTFCTNYLSSVLNCTYVQPYGYKISEGNVLLLLIFPPGTEVELVFPVAPLSCLALFYCLACISTEVSSRQGSLREEAQVWLSNMRCPWSPVSFKLLWLSQSPFF